MNKFCIVYWSVTEEHIQALCFNDDEMTQKYYHMMVNMPQLFHSVDLYQKMEEIK
jgi:hypothetical protein